MPKVFDFNPMKWLTPNTYDRNFKEPPESPGVYLLVSMELTIGLGPVDGFIVLYVGSSQNLAERYKGHEVLRILKEFYQYVQFYFIEDDDYRTTERRLIKKIQPKFNTQWR